MELPSRELHLVCFWHLLFRAIGMADKVDNSFIMISNIRKKVGFGGDLRGDYAHFFK
jgi:hypothetical protein